MYSFVSHSVVVLYIMRFVLSRKNMHVLTRDQSHNTFMMPWQYWSGIIKPKSAFIVTQNASNRLLQSVFFVQWNFLLTDCMTD